MRIDVFHHITFDGLGLLDTLARIESAVESLNQKGTQIMTTLDDLLAGVEEEKTQIDGLATLTANIKAQLDAVLAGALTPAQQAKVDQIFAAVQSGKQDAVDAINANTPAAPTP